MALVSTQEQTVHLGGENWFFGFGKGDAWITEHSIKYSPYDAGPIHNGRSLCICFCRQTEPTDLSNRQSPGAQAA